MEKRDLSVEAFLSNKVGVAALRTLVQRNMPLPISRIAKEIRSNYVTVRKHVILLEKAGLIVSVDYGKRDLYRADMSNNKTLVFKAFLENWNSGNTQKEG